MQDPALDKMLSKIEITEDGPRKGAIVEIAFTDGSTESATVTESLGHMRKKPLTDEQLYQKFMANVALGGFLDTKQAEKVFALALDFEKLESLQPILSIVAPK